MVFGLKLADMNRVIFFSVIFLVIVAVSPLLGIEIFRAAATEPLGCAMKPIGGNIVGFKESTCEERKLDVTDHPRYTCSGQSPPLEITATAGDYSGETNKFTLLCVKNSGKEMYFDITTFVPENTFILCNDFIDNDGDGLSDCSDSDCVAIGSCGENTLGKCAVGGADPIDLIDTDGDGFIDCCDTECRALGLNCDGACPAYPSNTLSPEACECWA